MSYAIRETSIAEILLFTPSDSSLTLIELMGQINPVEIIWN